MTARSRPNALLVSPDDDVAVCVEEVAAGTDAVLRDGTRISAKAIIPAGHKIAVRAITRGSPVRKYSQPIGVATDDIDVGDHVHVHNLSSDRAVGHR